MTAKSDCRKGEIVWRERKERTGHFAESLLYLAEGSDTFEAMEHEVYLPIYNL